MKTTDDEVLYNLILYISKASRLALRDSQVALQLLVNTEDEETNNNNLSKVEKIRKLVERNNKAIKELDKLFDMVEKKHDEENIAKELYYKAIKDPSSLSNEDKEKVYQAIKDGLITYDDIKRSM